MLKIKAPATVSDINVTPMVDIMLVLLIIFMVITPLLQKGVSVDLVHARNPRAMPDDDRDNAVEIAITRDGRLFLMDHPIKLDEIAPKIKDLLANMADKTVYVRADSRAKFGDVTKVVDETRAAGADDLGLITQTLQRSGGGITP